MNYPNKPITTCLINKKEHEYDFCSENFNAYDEYPIFKELEYIGFGSIHKIGGIKQEFHKTHHFWRKKDYTNINFELNVNFELN